MPTLCRDMPKTNFNGTITVKKKDATESGGAAANRWLRDQADGWCESGLCSNGKCQAKMDNVHLKLISDTADECGFEFNVDISCACPPVAAAPTPPSSAPAPAATPLTAAQMQQAVLDKLAILTHFNELIATPVPEPELSAFKAIRESMKGWLLAEITALTATPLGASKVWKEILTGIAAAGLGYVIEKIVGGVFGKILGPIGHILADPSTISGVDTEIIDTLIVRNPPDNCYKITWYRTRWPDELMWGPVRMKVEQIPCGG